MAQGTFERDSPYIQLPGVDAAQAKELTKKVKDFKEFIKMKPDERKKLALFSDAKQAAEVEKAVKVFPYIEVSASAFVTEEGKGIQKRVEAGNLMTI